MRGGGRGMRGMGRGRSNPRMNDMFRSRKQNTSRPPSMHVDDFMAMESAKTQDSPSMRRPGPKVRSLAPSWRSSIFLFSRIVGKLVSPASLNNNIIEILTKL